MVIITIKNKVTQKVLTCQITSTKKMNMEICKTFPIFLKIFLCTLDFGKFRAVILNMAKIYKHLVKRNPSDVLTLSYTMFGHFTTLCLKGLSSRIVLND